MSIKNKLLENLALSDCTEDKLVKGFERACKEFGLDEEDDLDTLFLDISEG